MYRFIATIIIFCLTGNLAFNQTKSYCLNEDIKIKNVTISDSLKSNDRWSSRLMIGIPELLYPICPISLYRSTRIPKDIQDDRFQRSQIYIFLPEISITYSIKVCRKLDIEINGVHSSPTIKTGSKILPSFHLGYKIGIGFNNWSSFKKNLRSNFKKGE